MLHPFILHNHQIRRATDPCLAPGQVGLLSGWGVFSTLRVAEGVLFAFERHWARIARDAANFHVPIPGDAGQVRHQLLELVEANRAFDSTLRVAIVRNGGGMWAAPSITPGSDLIALTADSKDWGRGVKLGSQTQARHAGCEFAGSKTLSWAMNLTWLERAQARGFDEVVLLNERGEIAECTSANIFIANGGEVATPPLASGCLPGITRELLLGEIHVPGIRLVERTLRLENLLAADEVFITSTTRNLLPVIQIEDRHVGRTQEASLALGTALATFVEHYLAEHKQLAAARR